MSNKLVPVNSPLAKSLTKSLQIGSLEDLVRVRLNENVVLIVDCSGSMGTNMQNGKRRIEGLREVVTTLKGEKESLRIVQFGHGWEPSFVTSVPEPDGGTPLDKGIEFARNGQANRAIVISDGWPDSPDRAIEAAIRFGGRIDVVFVGDAGDPGEEFLAKLAAAAGGTSFTGSLTDPKQIASKIAGLLGVGEVDDEDDE